ncbi:MAG TPA: hypothetical protein VET30_10015 [Pseudoxanthomonas sp.]|nr:hypothetical protein [Pseudoxanthomonas sp.]
MLPIALLAYCNAGAVTWAEQHIADPVDGGRCRVQDLASTGGYIYDWPEKYDQVFVPVTASEGVWYCEGSGFASFIGDTGLEPAERKRIAEFLARQTHPARAGMTNTGKLERAEAIYALRDLPPERGVVIHRILAYDFETIADDPLRARQHRQAALKIMLERLADETLPQPRRMEYLFVSANYLREYGDSARADRLLLQLEVLIAAMGEAGGQGYPAYLRSMLPSARSIAPGGRLAPEESRAR